MDYKELRRKIYYGLMFSVPDSREIHNIMSEFDDLVHSKANQVKIFRTPSQICSNDHVQMCHACEDIECGDNISPAKKRILELEKQLKKE